MILLPSVSTLCILVLLLQYVDIKCSSLQHVFGTFALLLIEICPTNIWSLRLAGMDGMGRLIAIRI